MKFGAVEKMTRIVDLDVDIGADAVDYKCVLSLFLLSLPSLNRVSLPLVPTRYLIHSRSAIANQESLSGLETEMRKVEGIVKELIDDMSYLKRREERFTQTNRTSLPFSLL